MRGEALVLGNRVNGFAEEAPPAAVGVKAAFDVGSVGWEGDLVRLIRGGSLHLNRDLFVLDDLSLLLLFLLDQGLFLLPANLEVGLSANLGAHQNDVKAIRGWVAREEGVDLLGMEIVKRRHQVRRVISLGATLGQASLDVPLRRLEGPPARSGLPRRLGHGLLRGLALGRGPSIASLWSTRGVQLGVVAKPPRRMATTIDVVRSILKLDSVPSPQERDSRVIVPVGFVVPNHSEHAPVLTKRVKRCGGADPQVGRKRGAMAGRPHPGAEHP